MVEDGSVAKAAFECRVVKVYGGRLTAVLQIVLALAYSSGGSYLTPRLLVSHSGFGYAVHNANA